MARTVWARAHSGANANMCVYQALLEPGDELAITLAIDADTTIAPDGVVLTANTAANGGALNNASTATLTRAREGGGGMFSAPTERANMPPYSRPPRKIGV